MGHDSGAGDRDREEGMLNERIQVGGGGARVMVVGDSMLILVLKRKTNQREAPSRCGRVIVCENTRACGAIYKQTFYGSSGSRVYCAES